jgi:hypothetical protein
MLQIRKGSSHNFTQWFFSLIAVVFVSNFVCVRVETVTSVHMHYSLNSKVISLNVKHVEKRYNGVWCSNEG